MSTTLDAQSTHSPSGQALPLHSTPAARRKALVRQLVRKELFLQRSNLFFAGAVFLIWLLLLALSFRAQTSLGASVTMGDLVQALRYFFVLPVLVVLLPLMIGASTLAPERKLATLDWQLSLPLSRRAQWALKAAVAAALAAFLGGVVAPVLDALLAVSLNSSGARYAFATMDGAPEEIPSLTSLLRGLWPGLYAIVAMAIGAYASSLTRDPYRALLAGVGVLAFLFVVSVQVDPTHLLFAVSPTLRPFVFKSCHALLLLLLAASILHVALSNYSLRPLAPRRLGVQFLLLALATAAITYGRLYAEFALRHLADTRPQRVWTDDTAALRHAYSRMVLSELPGPAFPPHMRLLLGSARPKYAGAREEQLDNTPTLDTLYRIPTTQRLLVTATSQADEVRLGTGTVNADNRHLIEVDVASASVRQHVRFLGDVANIFPDGNVWLHCSFGHSYNSAWHDSAWLSTNSLLFVPSSPVGLLLEKSLIPAEQAEFLRSQPTAATAHSSRRTEFRIQARFGKEGSSQPIPYFEYLLDDAGRLGAVHYASADRSSLHNKALLRFDERTNSYQIIDRREADSGGLFSYCASRDAAWYASACKATGPVAISRVDGSTSHTLSPHDALLLLADGRGDSYCRHAPTDLGTSRQHLAISPNGHFLAFWRVETTSLTSSNGLSVTGVPQRLNLCLLDLRDGSERRLLTLPASQAATLHLSHPLATALMSSDEQLSSTRVRHVYQDPDAPLSGHVTLPWYDNTRQMVVRQHMPPTVWSPDHKLAVLTGETLHVLRLSQQGEPLGEPLVHTIAQAAPAQIGFFCARYLLLWSKESLWRLDLEPPAQLQERK